MRQDRVILALLLGVLPVAFWPGSTSYEAAKFLVLSLSVSALLFNSAWRIGRAQGLVIPTNPQLGIWIGLPLVILLSGLLSETPALAVRTWILALAWLLVLWIASSRIREISHLRLILRAMTASAVATSLYGLAQIAGLLAGPDAALGVPAGISTFGNENQMAGLAALTFWPALGLMFLSRNRAEYLTAAIAVFVLLLAAVRADATGPLFALAGALLVIYPAWMLLRFGHRKFVPWFGLAAVALGTIAVVLVFARILAPDATANLPLPEFATRLLADNSGNIRRTDWLVAWHMVEQNGAGMSGAGNYQVFWPAARATMTAMPEYAGLAEHIPLATRAHNEYLQGLAEMGPMGLVYFLSLAASLLVGFRRGWRQVSDEFLARVWLFLAGGVVTTAIYCLVSFPLHLPAPALALAAILGLMAAPVFGSDEFRFRIWRTPRGVLLVPAVLGALVALGGVREFVGDLHVARGERAYVAGQMPDALAELQRGNDLMIWPGVGDLYQGLALMAVQRNTEAEASLEASLRHHPSYEAMLALAELATERQDYPVALAHLARVDNCRPTQDFRLQSRYLRGMLWLRQEKFARARIEFDRLLEQEPRDQRGLMAAGYLCVLEGDVAGAREYYARALRFVEEDLARVLGPGETIRLEAMRKTALRAVNSIR